MRVLEVQWSRALSLVCEVALILKHFVEMGGITEECGILNFDYLFIYFSGLTV
jgi:hypothetical protein